MSSVLGSSKPDSGFERTRKQGASGGKRCLQAAAVRWHWRRWMAERQVRHKELGFSWRWTGSRIPTCFKCDNAVRSRQRALETTTTFEVQKWFLWHVKTVQNQRNRVKINGYRFSPLFCVGHFQIFLKQGEGGVSLTKLCGSWSDWHKGIPKNKNLMLHILWWVWSVAYRVLWTTKTFNSLFMSNMNSWRITRLTPLTKKG